MTTGIKKTSLQKRKARRKKHGLGTVNPGQVLLLSSGSSDTKWKVIGWTLGVTGFGTACFFGYRWWKKRVQGKTEAKSLSIGDPENYALHLKKAFDNDGWPGTNNDEVFATFEQMPSYASFLAMQKAYQKLTGNVFEHDLDDEMSLNELLKIEDILKTKPDAPRGTTFKASN